MKRCCASSSCGAMRPGDRQHLRLEVVVAQHQRGDVVGHLREQRVALLLGELAVADRQAEQDLDVDLVIGRVDAGRVVDRVGVDAPARARVLDAAELRAAEVAAFDDDLAAQLAAVDAQRVVGAVADLRVRLARRLHVRADAAVVEQVDRRLQDRVDELGRRQRVGVTIASAALTSGVIAIDLALRGWTPPPGEMQLRVVVGPRRARQLEQALALGEASLAGIGIRDRGRCGGDRTRRRA